LFTDYLLSVFITLYHDILFEKTTHEYFILQNFNFIFLECKLFLHLVTVFNVTLHVFVIITFMLKFLWSFWHGIFVHVIQVLIVLLVLVFFHSLAKTAKQISSYCKVIVKF